MAFYTNIISCNTANSNTGVPQCSFDFGEVSKIMLVPKGYSLTQTDIQTLYATLQAKAYNSTESSRGYPIGIFTNIEDKSSETTLTQTGFGNTQMGKKGKFHFLWQYQNGGMNYDVMLNTFEDAQDSYDVLLFDKTANAIIGTKPAENTSSYVLKGLSLDLIYCPLPKLNADGTTIHSIGLCFADSWELLKDMAYYVLPASQKVNSIVGLRNLELSVHTAFTGTTGKIRITTDGGAIDLYDLEADDLDALTWTAWNHTTGAAHTVTSVTATAATKTLNFVMGAMTAGHIITIYSPTVTAMTSTVPGYGNGRVNFTAV